MTAFSANPGIESLPVTQGGLASSHPAAFPDTQECRLIRRSKAGDPGAFRSLVEAHQGMIHRLCVQCLQCEDDATEACQDTFLKAWQALPSAQETAAPVAPVESGKNAPASAQKNKEADAAWQDLERLLKGPQGAPKTKEEANPHL